LSTAKSLEYFGKPIEEFKNWTTTDAVHPDDLPRMIDAWRRAFETGQPLDFENRGPWSRWRVPLVSTYDLVRSVMPKVGIVRWYNLGYGYRRA